MEWSRKRRTGLIKGKLVKSLYRSAAPTHLPSTTTSDDTPPTVYHLQLHHHHHQPKEKLVPFNPNNINIALSSTFIVNQDQAAPPQKPKVSYYVPPQSNCTNCNYANMVDNTYGDESVDMKAAHYISRVQERFRSVDQLTSHTYFLVISIINTSYFVRYMTQSAFLCDCPTVFRCQCRLWLPLVFRRGVVHKS